MAVERIMDSQGKQLLRFGPFGVDPLRRVLTRDNEPVPLTPKAFEVLLVLIERRGDIVDKDELMSAVWPGIAVEENNLTRTISSLRKALGETAGENQYIVTVPGRGYTFVAAVTEAPALDATQKPEVEQRQTPPRRRSGDRWLKIGVPLAALAVVAAYLAFYRTDEQVFSLIEMVRLADAGDSSKAVISPDGAYVAYVVGDPGQQSLWIRQISAVRAVQLVPQSKVYYGALAFSPDSANIYYSVRDSDGSENVLFRIPVLGGPAERLLAGLDSPPSFSPDGSRFVFTREDRGRGVTSLLIARRDGGNVVTLATRKLPDYYDYPAWSPDGKRIACTLVSNAAHVQVALMEIDVNTRAEHPIGSNRWGYIIQLNWLGARGLVMSARTLESGLFHLWHVKYPSGEARRITSGLVAYRGVSATRDGRALVSIQDPLLSDIWIAPSRDISRAAEAVSGTIRSSIFSWMPDGRLLYEKNLSGHRGLWLLPAGVGQPQQVGTEGDCWNPAVSPDGGHFLCSSDRSGPLSVWLVSMDGSQRRELVKGTGETFPRWTPDGAWVVYTARTDRGWSTLWKAPIAGGPPIQLSDRPFEQPAVSPNGGFVVGFYEGEPSGMKRDLTKVAVVPIAGGPPVKVFPLGQSVFRDAGVHWTADGAGLAYVDNRDNASNIWRQSLTGGPPQKITDWRGDRVLYFEWSRNGQFIAFSRQGPTKDVVLIRDIR